MAELARPMSRRSYATSVSYTASTYSSDSEYNSEDYTTETDSDEESEISAIQYVKPKIYETGGGQWKSVVDRTTSGQNLTLEDKLKKWGIQQKSTESKFGRTQNLVLNHANMSRSTSFTGKKSAGISIDPKVLRQMRGGTKLVNKPVGTTNGVQYIDDDQNKFADEDKYTRSNRDVYIPGEYEERDHTGRSSEQITMYRNNMAFLNRLKPSSIRPKKQLTETELLKWLPKSHMLRSEAENACYVANKQRLATLRQEYETKNKSTSKSYFSQKTNNYNDVHGEFKNSEKSAQNIANGDKDYHRQASRVIEDSKSRTIREEGLTRTPSTRRRNERLEALRKRVGSAYEKSTDLSKQQSDSFQKLTPLNENSAMKEAVEELSDIPQNCDNGTVVEYDDNSKEFFPKKDFRQMALGVTKKSTIRQSASESSKFDKSAPDRRSLRKNGPKKVTQSESDAQKENTDSSSPIEKDETHVEGQTMPLSKTGRHRKFVKINASVASEWKKIAVNGIYKYDGLDESNDPYYVRELKKGTRKGKIYVSLWGPVGKRKWRIGPDMKSNVSWLYTKHRSTGNAIPCADWYESISGTWSKVEQMGICFFD